MSIESPKRVNIPHQLTAADIKQFDPLATPSPKKQPPSRLSFEVTIEPFKQTQQDNKGEKNGRFYIQHLTRSEEKKLTKINKRFTIFTSPTTNSSKKQETSDKNVFDTIDVKALDNIDPYHEKPNHSNDLINITLDDSLEIVC